MKLQAQRWLNDHHAVIRKVGIEEAKSKVFTGIGANLYVKVQTYAISKTGNGGLGVQE